MSVPEHVDEDGLDERTGYETPGTSPYYWLGGEAAARGAKPDVSDSTTDVGKVHSAEALSRHEQLTPVLSSAQSTSRSLANKECSAPGRIFAPYASVDSDALGESGSSDGHGESSPFSKPVSCPRSAVNDGWTNGDHTEITRPPQVLPTGNRRRAALEVPEMPSFGSSGSANRSQPGASNISLRVASGSLAVVKSRSRSSAAAGHAASRQSSAFEQSMFSMHASGSTRHQGFVETEAKPTHANISLDPPENRRMPSEGPSHAAGVWNTCLGVSDPVDSHRGKSRTSRGHADALEDFSAAPVTGITPEGQKASDMIAAVARAFIASSTRNRGTSERHVTKSGGREATGETEATQPTKRTDDRIVKGKTFCRSFRDQKGPIPPSALESVGNTAAAVPQITARAPEKRAIKGGMWKVVSSSPSGERADVGKPVARRSGPTPEAIPCWTVSVKDIVRDANEKAARIAAATSTDSVRAGKFSREKRITCTPHTCSKHTEGGRRILCGSVVQDMTSDPCGQTETDEGRMLDTGGAASELTATAGNDTETGELLFTSDNQDVAAVGGSKRRFLKRQGNFDWRTLNSDPTLFEEPPTDQGPVEDPARPASEATHTIDKTDEAGPFAGPSATGVSPSEVNEDERDVHQCTRGGKGRSATGTTNAASVAQTRSSYKRSEPLAERNDLDQNFRRGETICGDSTLCSVKEGIPIYSMPCFPNALHSHQNVAGAEGFSNVSCDSAAGLETFSPRLSCFTFTAMHPVAGKTKSPQGRIGDGMMAPVATVNNNCLPLSMPRRTQTSPPQLQMAESVQASLPSSAPVVSTSDTIDVARTLATIRHDSQRTAYAKASTVPREQGSSEPPVATTASLPEKLAETVLSTASTTSTAKAPDLSKVEAPQSYHFPPDRQCRTPIKALPQPLPTEAAPRKTAAAAVAGMVSSDPGGRLPVDRENRRISVTFPSPIPHSSSVRGTSTSGTGSASRSTEGGQEVNITNVPPLETSVANAVVASKPEGKRCVEGDSCHALPRENGARRTTPGAPLLCAPDETRCVSGDLREDDISLLQRLQREHAFRVVSREKSGCSSFLSSELRHTTDNEDGTRAWKEGAIERGQRAASRAKLLCCAGSGTPLSDRVRGFLKSERKVSTRSILGQRHQIIPEDGCCRSLDYTLPCMPCRCVEEWPSRFDSPTMILGIILFPR